MAFMITDACTSCGACLPECPTHAIYEGGAFWKYADGTTLCDTFTLHDGREADADEFHNPIAEDYYFIVADKCTECVGFHEEPQCAAVCPHEACVPDPDYVESKETLLQKKAILQLFF